ncbi:SAM-dependent methyltransferase [Proteus terrae]|uniref:SAM-dependent methyltransferase n=1 Tax=Proteus terrae TaxID=1574161 RepID=UPI00288917DF|nr:SAM-dependent methyltransferase [Proteus terrae]
MKPILDICYGSRMFYFDQQDNRILFNNIRSEEHILCNGRIFKITPDIISDFKNLPFSDNSFYQVLFDSSHLIRAGKNSWMFKKYGSLIRDSWRNDLKRRFLEAFQVLKSNERLIFKWSETQIPTKQILDLTNEKTIVI